MAIRCEMLPRSETFKGTFVLEDVQVLRVTKKKVKSPTLFSFLGHKFCLKAESDDAHLGLFVSYSERPVDGESAILLLAGFDLLHPNGKIAQSMDTSSIAPSVAQFGFSLGFDDFGPWAVLDHLGLGSGRVTIQWRVTCYSSLYQAKDTPKEIPEESPCDALSADWAAFLESGTGADITLRFDGGERMVHKAVLLARSEVFRRMFAHNMQEAIDGAISVPEIDADTADCFTHFLYAGRLLGEEGGAYGLCLRLLPLAKKYEVNSLVSFCAARLTYYLAESNAAELLRLADMYDVLPLKQHVVKFIARSMDTLRAVQDTAEFDKLDANLIKEVVSTMVAHCGAKHPRDEAEQVLEFPDGSDWARLSVAQLRRACSERKLPSAGLRAALLSRLSAGAVAPAAP